MATFTYLLQIDFDGEVRGYSHTTPQLVDGIAFGSGLMDLSLPARTAPLFGFGGTGGDLGFALNLNQTDVFDLQQKGVRLQRSGVRCWAWLEGQTLDEAVEIFRGEMRSPTFDFAAGTMSARAGAPAFVSDVPFPPTRIGDDGRFAAFANIPDGSLRLAVPVIYGTVTGSPLIPLEPVPGVHPATAVFVVAGHNLVEQTITVAAGGITGAGYIVLNDGVDSLGQRYAYINVLRGDYDLDLYAVSVEGKPAPDGGAIELLGDVLIDMWLSFGRGEFFDLDRKRVYSSQPLLNRYRVGALFNTRTEGQTLIDLLNTRFAQQYPVIFGPQNGQFGWDAVFIPPATEPPVLTIIYDQNVHQRGAFGRSDAGQVRNRFEVQYAQDYYEASSLSTRSLNESNDGVCRGSVSRWGQSPVHSWVAADVPDDGTAYLLAEDEAQRLSKVRWQVSYGLADPLILQLPLLGVVVVTDQWIDEDGTKRTLWVEKKFLIEGLVPELSGRVGLQLVEL